MYFIYMSAWLSNSTANRYKRSYFNEFVDISGNFTVRNGMYKWNAYGQLIGGKPESDSQTEFGLGVAMDVSGLTMIVGARYQDGGNSGTNDGAATVYRYDQSAEVWYQLGNTLTESNAGTYGFNVDINDAGNRVLVIDDASDKTHIYDYNSGTNNWDNIGTISRTITFTTARLSGDGNTFVISNYSANQQFMYRYASGSTWNLIGTITGANTAGMGSAISYDGNIVTMSERNHTTTSTNAGRATVYKYAGSGSNWTQVGSWINNPFPTTNGYFGSSSDLSKDGSIVAFGAAAPSGIVAVYQSVAGGDWVQLGSTIFGPENTFSPDNFGHGVRLSDDGATLLLNEFVNDDVGTDNGAVYIYKYINGDWVRQGDIIYGAYTGAKLGYVYAGGLTISGDGTKIGLGGYQADVNGTNTGYVQAFQWSQKLDANPTMDVSGGAVTIWGNTEGTVSDYTFPKLGTNITGNSLGLGFSVAMNYTGNRLVTGESAADNSRGNLFVYEYINDDWSQVGSTIIGPSGTTAQIGIPVDINNDGTIIATGSHRTVSNLLAGAIFVYEYNSGNWSQKGNEIAGSSSANRESFGVRGIALNGNGTIVAGIASYDDNLPNYVKVHQYVAEDTNDWVQMGDTFNIGDDSVSTDNLSILSRRISLDDSGTIMAFGIPRDDTAGTDNGKVEVYKFTGTVTDGSWNQLGSSIYGVVHSSGSTREGAVVKLSADGTILATGSQYYGGSKGYIRVFKYSEVVGDWVQMGPDIQNNIASEAWARGFDMSADGKTLAMGVGNADEGVSNAGGTDIFKYIDGRWVFVKHVASTYATTNTYLGKYVTMSGDGKRFAAGSNTNPGIIGAWEIAHNPSNVSPVFKTDGQIVNLDGQVGISQPFPNRIFKLHVGPGSGSLTGVGTIRRFNHSQSSLATTSSLSNGSILADDDIVTGGVFGAFSDRRIKKNIMDINDSSALEKLRLLKPTYYEYRDRIKRKVSDVVEGFIAQDVAEVLPYAVKTLTQVIPNVYSEGSCQTDASGNRTITIPDYDTANLEVDASGNLFTKIRLYDDYGKEINVVIKEIISQTQIRVQYVNELPTEVFVYGQEVDNFHTLQKDRIFTIATSALQEVDRQLQAEKAKTATLQTQLVYLIARVTALENK